MFMGWTKEDREDLVRGLRLFIGVPIMMTLIMFSLESLTGNKYELFWDPVALLAGLGLALVLKLIEVIVYKIGK